jgi:hypothetical protein
MSVERSPTRSDGLDHGQAAELCLGNTAELGVTERGVEGERLFQIGDPEPEVQHAHARQTRPTTPEVDAPASRSVTATGGEGPTVSEGDRLVARDATQQRVDTFG